MHGWRTAAVAIVLATSSTVAGARTTDLTHVGPWDAFGGTDDQGNEVCGMSTRWDDGRTFLIKRYEDDDFLVVQIASPGWRLDGGQIRVRIQMDDNAPWTAEPDTKLNSNLLEFDVPLNRLSDFMSQLRASQTLYLQMGSNAVRWTMDLTGTSAVSSTFARCVQTMDR